MRGRTLKACLCDPETRAEGVSATQAESGLDSGGDGLTQTGNIASVLIKWIGQNPSPGARRAQVGASIYSHGFPCRRLGKAEVYRPSEMPKATYCPLPRKKRLKLLT